MTQWHTLALFVLFCLRATTTPIGAIAGGGNEPACPPTLNVIVCENFQAGAPASEWDVEGSGDSTIQGFATEISVDQGETIRFKIKTPASSYRLDIYRLGYYDGMGARKVTTLTPSATLPQTQPACLTVPATGLIDCGNWSESASWAVPADAVSGIYFAKLVRADTGGASHTVFIVRDDDGGSELLFQTADTTWQAYNSYGGNSLYTGSPAGRAYKVSYNRPFNTRESPGGPHESWLFSSEYPMVRWLEGNGYDVSYFTGADSDRRGAEILEHKVFLSVGHDEYWSAQQRGHVEAARNAGVHLAFFSANEVFWKTRWESDASNNPYRTLACYKETHANAKIDADPAWTGTWRDPRFSPPSDGGRPENALTGTIFMVNGVRNDAISVPAAEGKLRFWRNTPIAALQSGQTATLPTGTLGYEWDMDLDNGSRPPGLIRLSSTTLDVTPKLLLDYGSSYGAGTATHHLTLYRHGSGALVFGAGTVQWSWGLDAVHDRAGTPADDRMQQATVNLLADMGVQPRSLRSGLVPATASTDTIAPSSVVTAPVQGASLQSGVPVTIAGTASDGGGGNVAGVEVSYDGGATWHPATGRATWSYVWTPFTPGSSTRSATLLSRATDDSGNVEAPASMVTVTILPGPGLVAAYGFEEASGAVAGDVSGNSNDGAISGASWTAAGRFGGALSFDGVDDWVTVADSAALDLTTAMTLEAWVRPTALSGWRTTLLKETPGGLAYALYANDDVPRPAAYVRVGGTETSSVGVGPIATGAWTHLAATYDAARLRIFVNGVEVNGWPLNGSIATSNAPLRLGANAIWGEHFQGLIDEVRVYRRALAPDEIQADMDTPVGGSPLPDTTMPTVSMTSPADGSFVNGTITIEADATDNVGVAAVQFMIDGAPFGAEDVAAPYSIDWDTTATTDDGHVIIARARDAAGNAVLSSEVSVTVANAPDTTNPSVAITSPAAGNTVSGTVNVAATASDNVGVAGVQFLLDDVALGAEDVSAPFSTPWNTTLATNGVHTLTARARDAAGNPTTSGPVSVTVSNAPPPSGLVAAYAFSEGAGTTTADASGTGRTGTLTGAAWTASGRFGGALAFDGVNDWVTIAAASALELTTGMTLEAWVNPAVLGGWRTVVMKETSGGLAYALYAHDNAPRPAVTINLNGDESLTGTAQLPTGAWTHLAATYDGASLRLFVNGVQVSNRSLTGAMATSASPLRLGGNAPWGEYFQGTIDEVRIFNRARTAAEIQIDMNTPVDGGPADTEAPAAPTGLVATGSTGAATLSWNPASDNRGVVAYNVHRGGAPGFIPAAANRIAQPASTSYTDGGLDAGTYYYRVTAQDAAGNVGAPSNEASAAVQAATLPIPGLVAAFGFNEGSGTTTADGSGNSHTAAISGATWTATGRYGRALSFDGVNDWVTIADAGDLDLATGMTIAAWVNPSALSGWRTTIMKEAAGGLAYALYAHDNAPHPAVTVNTGGSDQSSTGTAALPVNTWTHLAATYDGSTLRLFVNGVQVSSRALSGSLAITAGALRIGGNSVWGEYFSGLIDEARIYNRALTAAEIQSDMTSPIGG